MAYDLAPLLEPSATAVLVFECQEGIVGEASLLPGLAEAVRERRVLDHIATLLADARAAGARVVYCTIRRPPRGAGQGLRTPLAMRLRAKGGGDAETPDMGDVVSALAPEPDDLVVPREHGMTGFFASGLDAALRQTGTKTVVLTGVSLNVGVLGTAIEAVNHGYTVVVPTDCVAGDPPEYGDMALQYSVRNIAFLATSGEVAAAWGDRG